MKFSLKAITTQKWPFAKYCHTPMKNRSQVILWCLTSERLFGAITVKFLLNAISTQNMANLQNVVTRL